MTRVVVTISLENNWRSVIEEVLGGDADLTFLDDLEGDDRVEALARADALLSWHPHRELDDAELSATADAEFLQLMSAGVDHLDFDELPAGITVASNAGGYAEPVAEHVLALALALARGLREEHERLRAGEFNQRRQHPSLRNSTVGIVGFGGIGREVARLFEPFDAEILGINSTGSTESPADWCGTLDDLPRLLEPSDVLVLSIPLKERTRGLIGRQELEAMGTDGILVNVARGEILDARALYEHLEQNPDFKAGLEAWWREPFRHGTFELEYPFLELPNVIGCPHNSAVVPGALERGLRRAAENLQRELRWDEPEGVVEREEYGA